MWYTIDIERTVDSLVYCLNKINNKIENIPDWNIKINSGSIDCGIYFNFDLENKELEISNEPADGYDDSLYLDEIIDEINLLYGCNCEDDQE